MKPVRLLKKIAAAVAASLLAFAIVAGTATPAGATSGEIARVATSSEIADAPDTSGEIADAPDTSGEIAYKPATSGEIAYNAATSGEIA